MAVTVNYDGTKHSFHSMSENRLSSSFILRVALITMGFEVLRFQTFFSSDRLSGIDKRVADSPVEGLKRAQPSHEDLKIQRMPWSVKLDFLGALLRNNEKTQIKENSQSPLFDKAHPFSINIAACPSPLTSQQFDVSETFTAYSMRLLR